MLRRFQILLQWMLMLLQLPFRSIVIMVQAFQMLLQWIQRLLEWIQISLQILQRTLQILQMDMIGMLSRDEVGYVYAAFSEGNGVKIGMTCQDSPMQRIRALNTDVKHAYQMIDFVRCANPADLERFLHVRLRDFRVAPHSLGLFDVSPADVTYIFEVIKKASVVMAVTEDDAIDTTRLGAYLTFMGQ
mgnify:CR=1 FL=1